MRKYNQYIMYIMMLLSFFLFSCEKEEKVVSVESITLNQQELVLTTGDVALLHYEVFPADATEKEVSWSSSNAEVASVDTDGKVEAIAEGQSEITVRTQDGGKTAVCQVTVKAAEKPVGKNDYIDGFGVNHGPGVEIAGQIWAPVNCGYDPDHKYGLLYQWGRAVGQGYEGEPLKGKLSAALSYADRMSPADDVHYKGYNDGQYGATIPYMQWIVPKDMYSPVFSLGLNWNTLDPEVFGEKVQNPCPEGWKVPSPADLAELLNMSSDFIKPGDMKKSPDGLPGRWFGINCNSATAENPQGCIFLPIAGYRDYNGTFFNRGSDKHSIGAYWSDTLYDEYYITAGYLGFYTTPTPEPEVFKDHVSFAFSVRCIKK